MNKAIIIALCLVSSPVLASAPKPECVSLEKIQHDMGKNKGMTASPVTRAQFHFLQGISAAAPGTPEGLPDADNAILIRNGAGADGYIIWTMGALACGAMPAPAALLKLMAQVADGEDL